MSLSKSIVSGLARILEEDSFFLAHPRIAGHMAYGKQVHESPDEVRLLEPRYKGIAYHLRRGAAKAGLYFIARCSWDYSARELARKELKR